MSNQDNWPTTLDAAVTRILEDLKDDDKEFVRNTSFEELIRFHRHWGMGIRNAYGLWGGNKELIVSACGGCGDPDDASMRIVEAVWRRLNGISPQT